MSKPIIAIVGRPNVGKSTLFNRFSINKKAIVHDFPGVTRDRNYADAKLGPLEFIVMDTPGLENAKEGQMENDMMKQSIQGIIDADAIILLVDGFVGVTPTDKLFANLIRKYNSNCILALNKCEKNIQFDKEYFKLGMGEPVQISAEHGIGMAALCDELLIKLKDFEDRPNPLQTTDIHIAVVGRPNAGKSTFINALINEERLLTGDTPGLTRDAIDIKWQYKNTPLKLVDTAGLRRKSKIDEKLEQMSVGSTLKTIRFANTVILMIDATRGIEQQDLNIANLIIDEGRALVLAINKWDLIKDKETYKSELEYKLSVDLNQVYGLPCIYLSAIDKDNIYKVIDSCITIYKFWNKRIPTAKLNEWLQMVVENHPLPLQKNGRRVRIKYATQIKIRPTTIKFFSNYPDKISESYIRYLVNDLREKFCLYGVPIRTSFVSTENPYA